MKKLFLILLLFSINANAQFLRNTTNPATPTGGCVNNNSWMNATTFRVCYNGAWVSIGGSSSLSGSGTANFIPKYTGALTFGNSQITDTGSLITLPGNVTFSGAPTFSSYTLGSVLFAGTAGLLSQDNANLFWDATNTAAEIGPRSGLTDDADYYRQISLHHFTNLNTITANMVAQDEAAGAASIFQTNNMSGMGTIYGFIGIAQPNSGSDAGTAVGIAGGVTVESGGEPGQADGIRAFVNNRGTMVTNRAVHVLGIFDLGAGATTDAYGIDVDSITTGSSNNFAIKTNLGKVQFGDTLQAVTTLPGYPINALAQVAAIGTTTIMTVGASNALFHVDTALNCTATSAAATVNVTIGWTDTGSQAQSITLGSAVACTALGAASVGSLSFNFRAKAATNITYATSIVNTPTYDLSIALDQRSSL